MGRSTRPEFVIQQNKKGMSSERYSFPSTPYPHSILFIFKEYAYADLQENYAKFSAPQDLQSNQINNDGGGKAANVRKNSSIELPFPSALNDEISLRIEGFEQDVIAEKIARGLASYAKGGKIGDLASKGDKMLEQVGSAGAEMIKNMDFSKIKAGGGDMIGSLAGGIEKALKAVGGLDTSTVAAAAGFAARNILPGDMGKTLDAVTGKTLNPKETLAFGGVDLKSYQFDWTLFPSSPQDSQNIKNIVNLFKRNALPTVDSSIPGFERAFLNYPSVVDTVLIGVDESFWPRFKPAMISAVSADYTGGNDMTILRGGKPTAVTLSITINELGIHTAEDYGADSTSPATSTDEPEVNA